MKLTGLEMLSTPAPYQGAGTLCEAKIVEDWTCHNEWDVSKKHGCSLNNDNNTGNIMIMIIFNIVETTF